MTDNELHVVFGTGPVGLAVMDDLVRKGRRVRVVNRSGRADVAEGVEVLGGDAADPAFTRDVSRVLQSSTSPSTRPTIGGPSYSRRCRRAWWRARQQRGRSS